eukprot:CAMPEP_0169062710 /NCGR_PEP_ID=MMETSP1015-20121227/849_1 /TAXON_ID=342587 /ORGANISM="Karlodinium micrum, Strain CCMP2283" /LENGTH=219 /DNA_ID=CAMNT_0009120903 /DNA_START=62 /DNA_END=719 /DNA_ORIENTATION=-
MVQVSFFYIVVINATALVILPLSSFAARLSPRFEANALDAEAASDQCSKIVSGSSARSWHSGCKCKHGHVLQGTGDACKPQRQFVLEDVKGKNCTCGARTIAQYEAKRTVCCAWKHKLGWKIGAGDNIRWDVNGARALCAELQSNAKASRKRIEPIDDSRVYFAPEIKDDKCTCGMWGCGDAPGNVMKTLRDMKAINTPCAGCWLPAPEVIKMATWSGT